MLDSDKFTAFTSLFVDSTHLEADPEVFPINSRDDANELLNNFSNEENTATSLLKAP